MNKFVMGLNLLLLVLIVTNGFLTNRWSNLIDDVYALHDAQIESCMVANEKMKTQAYRLIELTEKVIKDKS